MCRIVGIHFPGHFGLQLSIGRQLRLLKFPQFLNVCHFPMQLHL
jgi:hypothetical protein